MALRPSLASDNWAGAHPSVLAAIAEASAGPAPAYGDDGVTARVEAWFRDELGPDARAFVVLTGSGANVLGLLGTTRPYHAVICTDCSHLAVDECGAPERIAGVKLSTLAHRDGRLDPDALSDAIRGIGVVHHSQPGLVSVTQATEYGTVYRPDDLARIAEVAHSRGLLVHMDGARIANAAARLGVSLRELTRAVGVDVLSFGGTKNGAVAAEAVVVFDEARATELGYLRKQSMQLVSKMRFVSAQLLALATDDLWLSNARRANDLADRLAAGLSALPGVAITRPVESNAVFAALPAAATGRLKDQADFHVWDARTGEVRLMTSWATTEDEIDTFVALAREAVSRDEGV